MKLIFCMQIRMQVTYKLILWFLMGMVKHSQSSQNSKFATSLPYLKKEVRDEVDFLHSDKHQSFPQVDFNTLGIKVSYKVILALLMNMIKHSQSTQSNKFAVSLQYFKKEVSDGVHFCKQINIKLPFLMEVTRHVQITQNRKLVIFLQYLKKKVLQQLLSSIVLQNIQIFYGGPVMFVVTCSIIFLLRFDTKYWANYSSKQDFTDCKRK